MAYRVCDGIQSRDPSDGGMIKTSSSKDSWCENGDTSNSNPLLHNLEPDDQLNAASGVKLARANAEQHVEIRAGFGTLTLEFCDVANVLEFGLSFAKVFTIFTTETAEDVASFLLTTNLDEPTRRFGEKPDDDEEDDKQEDLESNWESPSKAGLAALIEIAATASVISEMHKTNRVWLKNSLFEPVSNGDTRYIERELYSDELST